VEWLREKWRSTATSRAIVSEADVERLIALQDRRPVLLPE